MAPLPSTTGLSNIYTREKERLEVLKNVNLEVEEGEFLALMGPSGSGSTDGGQDQWSPIQCRLSRVEETSTDHDSESGI